MTDLPDDETLLARFRDWLDEARSEADWLAESEDHARPPVVDEPEVGHYRLAEEFTALRHEVKLQTRSSRALQEQAEALLPALRQAIEQFRGVAPKDEQAAMAVARPLAETLADLDEALDRGLAEVEKARRRYEQETVNVLAGEIDLIRARRPWYRRIWLRAYHAEVRGLVLGGAAGGVSKLLDALVEGYGLIRARLKRTLKAEKLERIGCVGLPVDPERMTVVELVDAADDCPPGSVTDEVRRGYTYRGRVFRYAEVRASRAAAHEVPPAEAAELEPEDEAGESSDES